eukprot:4272306-Amphidinium_carterae.1
MPLDVEMRGNLRYDLLRHVDKQTRKVVDPSKYYMVEQFENLEAYKVELSNRARQKRRTIAVLSPYAKSAWQDCLHKYHKTKLFNSN